MASEKAIKLVNQVVMEGRFHDKTIDKAKIKAEYNLDVAIDQKDTAKVKKLRSQYAKGLKYVQEARSKKYTATGKYWAAPEWLLFLLVPFGWAISTYLSSEKTKFSADDLDRIEETLTKAIEKCDDFLNGKKEEDKKEDEEISQEAALLIETALKSVIGK